MSNTLRYAARSDVGLKRSGNEDSGLADDHLLIVADGMGGHAAGELASATAIATFAEIAEEDIADDEVLESLSGGVDRLTERIGDIVAADPSSRGMGTTITGLYWRGDRVAVVHVGDSRAYRLRDDQLDQITRDHTYVQSLVDSGEITPEQALHHPRRHLLMRAVDGIRPVEADLSMRSTRPGDRYLLCSDGLSGVVGDDELARVMADVADPTFAVTRLVDMALEAGAPDNVTVVVADVHESDEILDRGTPVVVGAAGEPGNRAKLPNVPWPVDAQLDPDDPRPRSAPSANETQPIEPIVEPPEPVARRPRWIVAATSTVAVLVVALALVGVALLWWLRGQWYVGDADGTVTVYHGVRGTLGPVPLQVVSEHTDVLVSELPELNAEQVEAGIVTSSREQSEATVQKLREAARECQEKPSTPGCPPSDETAEDDPAETDPGNAAGTRNTSLRRSI